MDERRKIECPLCITLIPVSRLSWHEEECRQRRLFTCDLCPRAFESKSGLTTHQSWAHSGVERGCKYLCSFEYCDFGTDNRVNLEKHYEKHARGFRRSRSRSRSRSRQPANATYDMPQLVQNSQQEQSSSSCQATPELHSPASQIPELTSNETLEELLNQHERLDRNVTETIEDDHIENEQSADEGSQEQNKDKGGTSASSSSPIAELTSEGMYNLRIVDPVEARRLMAADNRACDNIVSQLREQNNMLRQLCLDRGVNLGPDQIGEMIDDYMQTFGVTLQEEE